MSNMVRPNSASSRDTVLKLMEEKNKIESQISAFMETLSLNRIGMHDPLVDSEGYPRQDIDVYQVRHARHRIVCLQNDHKAIMKDIEEGLHAVHSQMKDADSNESMETESLQPTSDPIAHVTKVAPGSPAAQAGLEALDKIIEFGSVNASNFRSLKDISFVTSHSVGQPLALLVLRGKHSLHMTLTPRPWGGQGLLGCVIVMPENVDR